jgi:hypothetical protein
LGADRTAVAVGIVRTAIFFGSNRRFAMSALKPLALGILVWAAMGGVVRADAITSPNSFNWVIYFAGQNGNGGGFSAPVMPGSTATALPATPPPVPTQATVVQPPPQEPTPLASTTVVSNVSAAPVTPVASATAAPVTPVASATTYSTPAPASSGPVNAFINLGNGPYPLQNTITTGNAQPWYNSSQISGLFGGQPTAGQIQSFDNAVLQRVQQTFSQSGVPVTLTDNPSVAALHTLSLVSNTSSSSLSSAIGMTQVGGSGFSFIDHIASSAQSVDQLQWIVSHNISHELMLAFGVPENYDQTGNYIDSKLADWAMMVNPSSTFSPAAAQALAQALAAQNNDSSGHQLGAQVLGGESPVPEPTTVALWALAAAAAVASRRIRSRHSQAGLTKSCS